MQEAARSGGLLAFAASVVRVTLYLLATFMWKFSRRHLAAIVGLALACDGAGPFGIKDVEPFTPPASYRQHWADVEECSGRQGDFDRVKWFRVPDQSTFSYRGQILRGYWWPDHNIVIAGSAGGAVVRHEILHDLLGTGDHPAEYFVAACGGLVTPPLP